MLTARVRARPPQRTERLPGGSEPSERVGFILGLLAEQLLQAVGRAVGHVGGELAMEHELVALDGEHHHLARRQRAAGVERGLRLRRQIRSLPVDLLERLEQRLHRLARRLRGVRGCDGDGRHLEAARAGAAGALERFFTPFFNCN